MINDIFKSFFRTIGRILAYIAVGLIIAYLSGFIKPSVVKADVIPVSLSYLNADGRDLLTNKWYSIGSGNSSFSYDFDFTSSETSSYLYISIVLCADTEYSGGYLTDTSEGGKVQTNNTSYSCMYTNSGYTGGKVRIINFLAYSSGSNTVVVYQSDGASVQLIDFVVNTTSYVNPMNYSSQTAISQNSQIINQNTTIINKQSETNTKIDTTNSKLDEAENTRKGILGTIKSVLSSVVELPKKIIDLMITALKSLFIPEDTDFLNDFVESIESKLGFIAEVPVSIIEFGLGLANASWTEVTSISLPTINIFGYYFWNAQEIDISQGINIFKPYKYITDILCVTICISTLNKWRERFTGGGS